MGCGQYSELMQIPKIRSAPWLFRMNSEGDVLWEHAYIEYDSSQMESHSGPLIDFIEMENGDIIAVGTMHYNDGDMLIMRVDSNGCLYNNNCHVNILTSDEVNSPGPSLSIYPNPMNTKLFIKSNNALQKIQFKLFDINGEVVKKGQLYDLLEEINVENLTSGIYFVQVIGGGGFMELKKIVKTENNRL